MPVIRNSWLAAILIAGCTVIPEPVFVQRLISDEPRVGDVIQVRVQENIGGVVADSWMVARVRNRIGTAFLAVEVAQPFRRAWLFDVDRGTGWR